MNVDSLVEINNITGSNTMSLRKVNIKPYGFDKMYTYKDLMKNKLYPFQDGGSRTCKILFANDDKINLLMM